MIKDTNAQVVRIIELSRTLRQMEATAEQKTGFIFRDFILMMSVLSFEPRGIHPKELAEYLGITNSAVSPRLKILSNEGLLVMRREEADRRNYLIHVTEKARQRLENVNLDLTDQLSDIGFELK